MARRTRRGAAPGGTGATAHDPRQRSRRPDGAADRRANGSCAICGREPVRILGELEPAALPDLICPSCDARATGADGLPLDPFTGAPPNPVYVGGRRCWRLYRLGGWVTVVDRGDAPTLDDFVSRRAPGRRPR